LIILTIRPAALRADRWPTMPSATSIGSRVADLRPSPTMCECVPYQRNTVLFGDNNFNDFLAIRHNLSRLKLAKFMYIFVRENTYFNKYKCGIDFKKVNTYSLDLRNVGNLNITDGGHFVDDF
jgi:hypothetical protein